MFVDFDGEDRGCAYGSRDRDRKQSDRAATGYGYSFRGDFPRQHGVDGVAQRIENGGVFLRDGGIQFPDIRFGDDDVCLLYTSDAADE